MDAKNISAWVRDWLVLSASVMFAAWALDGISCNNLATLLVVAAVISLLNAFVRPLLILLSVPFLIATFGLGAILILWVINSLILMLAGSLISGFHVASFGAAMGGALFIGIAQIFLNAAFGIKKGKITTHAETPPPASTPRQRRREENDDDVIDI